MKAAGNDYQTVTARKTADRAMYGMLASAYILGVKQRAHTMQVCWGRMLAVNAIAVDVYSTWRPHGTAQRVQKELYLRSMSKGRASRRAKSHQTTTQANSRAVDRKSTMFQADLKYARNDPCNNSVPGSEI